MQLALAEAQYDLAAELLRFVVPPTDSENAFSGLPAASENSAPSHAASQPGKRVAPGQVHEPYPLTPSSVLHIHSQIILNSRFISVR